MADPRSVCRAFVAGMDARCWQDIEEMVTDDVRFVLNDRATVGRDALAHNFEHWFKMVPDSRTAIRQLVAEDDLVVVHIEISGTRLSLPQGELTGVWSFPACAICTVTDGRIAEWREFSAWDTPEKLIALVTGGAASPPAGVDS